MSSVAPSAPVDELMSKNDAGEAKVDAIQLYDNFVLELQELRYCIESDLFACDAKWTLFVAAANSYLYETLLNPFPPSYINETTGRNIDALLLTINQTPRLEHVLQIVCKDEQTDDEEAILDLLHYVLVEQNESMLHSVSPDEFVQLMSIMGQRDDLPRPTNVFGVGDTSTFLDTLQKGRPQESLDIEKRPKLAFHSNKLDRFYAMLMNGVLKQQQRKYKDNVYDELEPPILLNTDLNISIGMSPEDAGWGLSRCGLMIKCVAVCEYDNQEEHVTWSKDSTEILIHKSDLVRIRYLLFYSKCVFKDDDKQEPKESSWLERNKYALSLAGCMILIASIGVFNSRVGHYWRQVVRRNSYFLWECCRRFLNLG